jgi:hypothetical protein
MLVIQTIMFKNKLPIIAILVFLNRAKGLFAVLRLLQGLTPRPSSRLAKSSRLMAALGSIE